MSFETTTQYFDVVGPGFVHEHHADQKHANLSESDNKATGVAIAWLTFYATAALVVVTTNVQKAADFVLASAN